jgi:hypothetical protein
MTSPTKPIAAETLAAFRDLGADERDCAFLLAYDCKGNLALAAARARELAPRDPSEARLLALLDLLGPAAAMAIVTNSPLGPRLAAQAIRCVEVLDRRRGKGQQLVRVEHVHVHSGAQAIVGAVNHPGRGDGAGKERQSHAKALAHAPEPPLSGTIEAERAAVPCSGGEGRGGLPDARRAGGRARGRAERPVEARPAQRGGAGGAEGGAAAAAAGQGRAGGPVTDG